MRTLQLSPLVVLALPLLTPPGAAQTNFTKLYTFGNLPDAEAPGGLVVGPDGVFYGVSAGGGSFGDGSVFELQPPTGLGAAWTETILYSFTGENGDGIAGSPTTTPVFGPNGAIYGTTAFGGTSGAGTVFELQPPAAPGGAWTEAVLCSFPGDGQGTPIALVAGEDGTLYGATWFGGGYGQGMAFALTPPGTTGGTWTESVLYNFTGTVDGANPTSTYLHKLE